MMFLGVSCKKQTPQEAKSAQGTSLKAPQGEEQNVASCPVDSEAPCCAEMTAPVADEAPAALSEEPVKETPKTAQPKPAETPKVEQPKPAETTQPKPAEKTPQATNADLAPLPLVLPKPMFVGTPTNITVPNLMKPLGKARPAFYAPKGCVNLAAGKVISSTDDMPIIGEIEMITDGDKEAADGSYVELGPFQQHITIDLEKECEIYAVLAWHYHKEARVYFDVVVQTADDADFITNVQTVFNNDIDNSAGLGIGKDMHYIETSEGKLIDAKGVKGRYVRLYSNGSNANDLNNYIEVEVWGKVSE